MMGNARLSFTDKNNNGLVDVTNSTSTNDILQVETQWRSSFSMKNHYYAFGTVSRPLDEMTHEGPFLINQSDKDNAYMYNGKEMNGDHGLNWSDYGARYYDACLGRWTTVDPLAEKASGWSPYRYGFNNPMTFTDPTGMFEHGLGGKNPHSKKNHDEIAAKNENKQKEKEEQEKKAKTESDAKTWAKEINEQDNNYNFFSEYNEENLRWFAEYFYDGGASKSSIAINAHGSVKAISTLNGGMDAGKLHIFLLTYNDLYRFAFNNREIYLKNFNHLDVHINACRAGKEIAPALSKLNPVIKAIAPTVRIWAPFNLLVPYSNGEMVTYVNGVNIQPKINYDTRKKSRWSVKL